MKKTISAILALALCVLCLTGAASAEGTAQFKPGTYEATVDSVRGPLTVSVTVSEDRIEAVDIKEINDTKGVRDAVVERYPKAIVENQSINLDAISGASLSSAFVKLAVRQALSQATDNLDALQTKVSFQAPAQNDMDVDVVVVGGGLAGLSAATTVAAKGYSVVLLEQLSYLGGNAIVSGQGAINVRTSGAVGEDIWDEELAFLVENGADLEFTDFVFFGEAYPRLMPAYETEEDDVVNQICIQMRKSFEEHNGIVLTETPAVGLIIEDGEVKGVVAKPLNQDEFSIHAKATLLATGGFQGNADMIAEYLPFAVGAMRIGPSKGAGEAYAWLEGMNVSSRDLEWPSAMFYSISPSGDHAVSFVTNFVDDNGDLLSDSTDYNTGSMEVFKAIGNKTCYCLWSKSDLIPGLLSMEGYLKSGAVKEFPSLSAILETYDLPHLIDTMTERGYEENDTYYVAIARPGIYGVMGGIEVDDSFRVMTTDGTYIPGVFAAGETIGRTYGGSVGGASLSGYEAAKAIDSVLSEG
ncbi:MAG: FAD-binding protein [Lachnospiraceae bacterium]|nr:FAD-binding protein [Lachnospiraceae bacterium]